MSREDYDDRITADCLEEGDELHLTVMGGDEYFTVTDVRSVGENQVEWWATGVASLHDTVSGDTEVWIRKKSKGAVDARR